MKELNLGKNTIAIIASKLCTIITGILITRILVLNLSHNDYGFYVFIWSISSTLFFADLGMGLAAQKKTAEFLVHQDFKKLSNEISTIFFFYLSFLVLFCLINYFGISPFLEYFLKLEVSPDKLPRYQELFFICTTVIAFNFTISFFREVIIGLHKTYIINSCLVINQLTYLGVILLFERFDLGLRFLIMAVPGNQTLLFIFFIFLAKRLIPDLHISPKNCSMKTFKKILSFSLHAYAQAVIVIVQKNIFHIAIGALVGTVTVGMYQIANKAQEIMKMLNDFYQANVLPSTSYLHKLNKIEELKKFIINSNRLIFFTGTCSFFAFYFLTTPLLYIWLDVTNLTIQNTAKYLVIDVYLRVIFSSVNTGYLIMSGREKQATKFAIIDIALNTISAIIVLEFLGMVAMVAIKIPITIGTQFWGIQRLTNSTLHLSMYEYFKKCILRTGLVSILPAVSLFYFVANQELESWTLSKFVIASSTYGITFILLGYIFVLLPEDRKLLREKFPKLKFLFFDIF